MGNWGEAASRIDEGGPGQSKRKSNRSRPLTFSLSVAGLDVKHQPKPERDCWAQQAVPRQFGVKRHGLLSGNDHHIENGWLIHDEPTVFFSEHARFTQRGC